MPARVKQAILDTWHRKRVQAAASTEASVATTTASASNTNATVNELHSRTDWQQGINSAEYQSHLYKRVQQPITTTMSTGATNTIMITSSTTTTRIPSPPPPPRVRSTVPSAVGSRAAFPSPAMLSLTSDDAIARMPKVTATPSPVQVQKFEADAHIVHNSIPDSRQVFVQLGNWSTSITPRPHVALQPDAVQAHHAQSNALLNMQRSKRFMPVMQLKVPMTYHMSAPVMMLPQHAAYLRTPTRLSMDQLYQQKLRAAREINMFAYQQQYLGKALKQQQNKALHHNALQQQHSNYAPLAAYQPYMPSYAQLYVQPSAVPVPKVKRLPYGLNLNVVPMLDPTKPFKASPLISANYRATARPYTSSGSFNSYFVSANPAANAVLSVAY